MKLMIIPLLISYTINANAQSNTIKKIDINGDGKVDRFEVYKGKKLVEIREDRNVDSKIDYITLLDGADFTKQTRQDTNFDGKFDRIKTYRPVPLSTKGHNSKNAGKTQVKIQIDKNHDGKYEIEFFNYINPIQQTDGGPCPQPSLWDEGVLFFDKISKKISVKLNGGFVMTGLGYKIEESCLEKWGNNLPNLIRDTMDRGIQCLKDLSKDSKTIVGSARLANDLTELLKEDRVSIMCTDKDDDPKYWDGVMAHASASPTTTSSNGKVKHPFMAINPFQPKTNKSTSEQEYKAEIDELKKTLFHEQLHNLGISHNEDIEYSYACEDCCLSYKDGENERKRVKSACKVCKGDYSGQGDIDYVRDIEEYSMQSYNVSLAESASFNYLKENPDSPKGMAYMAKILSSNGSTIGNYIATKLVDKKSIQNDPEAKAIIKELNDETSFLYNKEKSSPVIAASIYKLYVDRDINKSIAILEKHKKTIASSLKELDKNDRDGNSYYIYQMKTSLNNLMRDIYINDYLRSDEHNTLERAGELYRYFNAELP